MKKNFKDLIRGIMASSIAAIAGTHGADAVPVVTFNDSDTDSDQFAFGDAKKDLSYKLLLQINDDDSYSLSGHRSHSSHRSHRSHRSGSSHYSSTTATRSNSTTSAYVSPSSYTAGSRVMKKDLYGSDVKQLTDWLVKCEYLKPSQVSKNYSGYVVYNDDVAGAVKSFQKDMKLAVDGLAGPATVAKLKEYAANYYKLGERVLKVGMSGTDVSEMNNYLIDKGYSEGEKLAGAILFDVKIENALKAFLADEGLEWTGETNPDIVSCLKKKCDD
ncbi:MAG: peptidoglycan-binding protein [Bacteroidales bacterium]|nr:peptidoglycan-binding protein [Bacteroidales bacterium]